MLSRSYGEDILGNDSIPKDQYRGDSVWSPPSRLSEAPAQLAVRFGNRTSQAGRYSGLVAAHHHPSSYPRRRQVLGRPERFVRRDKCHVFALCPSSGAHIRGESEPRISLRDESTEADVLSRNDSLRGTPASPAVIGWTALQSRCAFLAASCLRFDADRACANSKCSRGSRGGCHCL